MKALLRTYYELYQWDPDAIKIIQAFQHGNLFPQMSDKTQSQLNDIARVNFQIARRMIAKAKDLGLLEKEINVTELHDVLLAAFTGVVLLEESKFGTTGKDHLFSTLDYVFYVIAKAICSNFTLREWKKAH